MGKADSNNDKRINLAAPLISVRRHGGAGVEAPALPSYKPGETLGPLGHAGTVPFRWEHRPGHPKSVRTRRPPPPPTTAAKEAASPTQNSMAIIPAAVARAEEERFSDARSRDDVSCVTVNCSATGLSDAASAGAARPPGSRGGGAMMDRFLPAAHAVAEASPLTTFRKAGSVRDPARAAAANARADDAADVRSPPVQRPLPLQHIPAKHVQLLCPQDENEQEDDDDDEWDVHSTQAFASKRCGLLPTRCVSVKNALLLLMNSAPAMRRSRGEGKSLAPSGGRSRRDMMNTLLRRSRSEQQQPRHTGGHDPGTLSWEELYIKPLLRSARGSLMGPAAAVASELDRTVRELYRRRGGEVIQPKANHLGLLLVLDRSHEQCQRSSARNVADAGEAALLLPRAKSSPNARGKELGRGRGPAGKYGFPLLLEDKAAETGREIVLSPRAVLPLPSPKSPSESWLSRALPSVSNRPPPTSFLGLHVQSKKHSPQPRCTFDPPKVVDRATRRKIRVHDLLN